MANEDFRSWRPADLSGFTERMTTHETHMCPYCDLVFRYHTEVVDHVRHDHPEHAEMIAGLEPRELPHE